MVLDIVVWLIQALRLSWALASLAETQKAVQRQRVTTFQLEIFLEFKYNKYNKSLIMYNYVLELALPPNPGLGSSFESFVSRRGSR